MLAFIAWAVLGVFFIVFGIRVMKSKRAKPFGFWANAEVPVVTDVQAYNRALGKLWCIYGGVLVLLGVPLLDGQNSPFVFISIVGTMLATIVVMVVYTIKIEEKYKEK